MKILLITQFFSTTRGGGEYLFREIANSLARKGHKIWIITHKMDGENYSNLENNVKLIFTSSIQYKGGLPPTFNQNIRFILSAIKEGMNIVKKEKIEIIHSNNFSPAFSASIISALSGIPHITSIWDIFTLCGKNFWRQWAKQEKVSKFHAFLGPKFEKLILKLPHVAIHTISKTSENDLYKFGAKKPIIVIQPSIEIKSTKKTIKRKHQIVYVGRLVFYKNVETVLNAISLVKESIPNIELIIIGGGPHETNLQKKVDELNLNKNVKFLGYVSSEDKINIISESAAMVFPSLCEGFGLVILEAFSQKVPVLVSDVMPLPEIVENEKDGLVISAIDEKKWAEKIMYIIKNPEIAQNLGESGYKKLHLIYNEKLMISQIENVYKKNRIKYKE